MLCTTPHFPIDRDPPAPVKPQCVHTYPPLRACWRSCARVCSLVDGGQPGDSAMIATLLLHNHFLLFPIGSLPASYPLSNLLLMQPLTAHHPLKVHCPHLEKRKAHTSQYINRYTSYSPTLREPTSAERLIVRLQPEGLFHALSLSPSIILAFRQRVRANNQFVRCVGCVRAALHRSRIPTEPCRNRLASLLRPLF